MAQGQPASYSLGTNLGTDVSASRDNLIKTISWDYALAEREGFEPPIPLRVCRISSAVLSTTQPPLQAIEN